MGELQPRQSIGWDRLAVQLGGGIAISALLPYLVRMMIGVSPDDLAIVHVTLFGVTAATIAAIWLTRHMSTYPGEEAAAALLPSFGLSYGILLSFYILTRIEYLRSSLVFAFVAGIIWMLCVLVLSQRRIPRIGVLPFGNIEGLPDITRVNWIALRSPDDSVQGLDAVTADLRNNLPDEWATRLADYALAQLPVLHTKHLMESLTGRVELEHLSENNFGSLAPRPAYMALKHTVDWIVAAIFIVLLSPALLILAVIVRLSSPGPALFVQERVGYLGRPFKVYKFRTMSVEKARGADLRQAAITQAADQRITPLGKFLRKTRLDELPQLINVLKCEMSFIGPRPEAAVLSKWYEEKIPFYRYRHIIRPGIAGWAQVCQGHVADVDGVRKKLHYDFYYIKHYSPWIDMLIAVRTIKIMFTGYGAK